MRARLATRSLPVLGELLEGEVEETKYGTACLLLMSQLPTVAAPSLAAFIQLERHRHLASEGFDLSGGTAADRIGAMTARAERDDDLRAAAPYGGSGSGAGSSEKNALESDPKARLHIKASTKVLPAPDMRADYCQRHRLR